MGFRNKSYICITLIWCSISVKNKYLWLVIKRTNKIKVRQY